MVTRCAMILYNIPSAIKDLLRVQDIKMSWHGIMGAITKCRVGRGTIQELIIIEANAFYFPGKNTV